MARSSIAPALALSLALATPLATGAITEITWNDQGRFERRISVAPGKFAEACGALARGEAVSWRFDASAPLNFNIHYHEGKEVRFPERRDALASATGRLEPAIPHTYCWMWTNKSAQPVELQWVLVR